VGCRSTYRKALSERIELDIGFRVHMTISITTNGGGVDNFGISADCSGRRDVEEINIPENEPSGNGEDGSFYCLSENFPCEGGNSMVHVCHYSTLLAEDTRRSASPSQTLRSSASILMITVDLASVVTVEWI
jgi:hypothetical protein